MALENFQLKNVNISCGFPESPVFWEATSLIVKKNILNYEKWARGSKGFQLKKGNVNSTTSLQKESISIEIDSFPNLFDDIVKIISTEICDAKSIITDTIQLYEYDCVNDLRYKYRFFIELEQQLLTECINKYGNKLIFIPNLIKEKLGNKLVDFGWSICYPYNNDIWIYINIISMFKKDYKLIFSSSDDNLKEGLLVNISLSLPEDKNTLSLELLKNCFDTPPQEFYSIANLIIESIEKL